MVVGVGRRRQIRGAGSWDSQDVRGAMPGLLDTRREETGRDMRLKLKGVEMET